MEKIEIKVNDVSLLATALNNVIVTYGDVLFGVFIGCEISSKLEPLKKIPYTELEKRFECLKDIY